MAHLGEQLVVLAVSFQLAVRGHAPPSQRIKGAIRSRVDTWNDDPRPSVWHKTAHAIQEHSTQRSTERSGTRWRLC